MRNKKSEHNKVVLLAKIKLNSIENIISKARIDNKISHDEFAILMNEVENYHKLEEKIKMMTRQRKGTERFKIPNIDIL